MLRRIARYFWGRGRTLEKNILLMIYEFPVRAFYYLCPSTHIMSMRIKKIQKYMELQQSGKFVVFVTYICNQRGVDLIVPLLKKMKKKGFNVLLVNNTPLKKFKLTPDVFKDLCWTYMERNNGGRDFGGYKDGILYLYKEKVDVKRLVILNDSCYFIDSKLDKFVEDLSQEEDFIGMTEMFAIHYHVSSFCVSVSGKVFNSKKFKKFWNNYIPISTRWHAIHHGEVKLTKTLVKSGFAPYVLYKASDLLPKLIESKMVDFFGGLLNLLPAHMVESLFTKIDIELSKPNVPKHMLKMGKDNTGSDIQTSINEVSSLFLENYLALSYVRKQEFLNVLMAMFFATNQTHAAGMLFTKLLDFPLMKKDLFYRQVYDIYRIDQFVKKYFTDTTQIVLSDFRSKGSAAYIKGNFNRRLYSHGMI